MRTLLFAVLLTGCLGGAPVPDEAPAPPTPDAPATPAPAPGDLPTIEPAMPSTPPDAPTTAPTGPTVRETPTLLIPPSEPTRTPAEAPLTGVPDSLYACTQNSDCVVECDLPGNCCGAPCGCRTAVNRTVLAELKTHPWKQCSREETHACPAVGCAYEPAMGAVCEAGRCRGTEDPFGMMDRPPAAPIVCKATTRSTIPGISISVPSPKCQISVADAVRGQTLEYVVSVAANPPTNITTDYPDAGHCSSPGPDGLNFGETVRGVGDSSKVYGILDTGLCGGFRGPGGLVAGRHVHTFEWKAVEWSGPSDFGAPEGPAFPPGRYEIALVATGTLGDKPYTVEARIPIELTP